MEVDDMDDVYSEVRFEKLPTMRVAKHTIISSKPEDDVFEYMENWAKESGLMDLGNYTPRKYGWNVEVEGDEKERNPDFRGYALCITLPEDFTPRRNDIEILLMNADEYAILRIIEPFADPFVRIGGGWQKVLDYVQNSEYKTKTWDNRYAFEEIIVIDGVTYMDVFMPIK